MDFRCQFPAQGDAPASLAAIFRDFSGDTLAVGLFADAGDVSRGRAFRFDHPQTSVGLGFRLLTLIGAVRLDFGWRSGPQAGSAVKGVAQRCRVSLLKGSSQRRIRACSRARRGRMAAGTSPQKRMLSRASSPARRRASP